MRKNGCKTSGNGHLEGSPYLLVPGRLIRAVVSQRAGGLLIVINMNPNQVCNFDCLYCEVRRSARKRMRRMNVPRMSRELCAMLSRLHQGGSLGVESSHGWPADLSKLRGVALSGDGEPTLCPEFYEVVQEIDRIRRSRAFPWFKMILVTNSTGLDLPAVRSGLSLFTESDEIWAKLDGGTQSAMRFMNQSEISFRRVLCNIRQLAQWRPVIIQSMFCQIDGQGPTDEQIDQYVSQLKTLKRVGARIALIQIYSTSRPAANPRCKHLPLSRLSQIARKVREHTGLRVEVY